MNNYRGKESKVKTFEESDPPMLPSNQGVRLEFYQLSDHYVQFIFTIINSKSYHVYNEPNNENEDNMLNEKKEIKKSYVFVRKTRQEMEKIFRHKSTSPILKPEDTVFILKSY